MSLKQRRLLYLSFFLLFFISAPVVILWVQGYKINWQTRSFQKTGILFLESNPKDAEIYLNGQLQTLKTTARLKGLFPGEYQVEVKKKNYFPWIKKIKIYPSKTTFAQYIRLFKQDLSIVNLLTPQEQLLTFSEQSNNKIALATIMPEHKQVSLIYLMDLADGKLEYITQVPYLVERLVLNQTTDEILMKTKNDWLVFSLPSKKTVSLEKISRLNFNQVKFDINRHNIFYAVSKLGLEKINVGNSQSHRLVSGQIMAFYIDKDNLYYLRKKGNLCQFITSKLNLPDQIEKNIPLPCAEKFNFYPAPEGIVNFIDINNSLAYFFDFEHKFFDQNQTILPETKSLKWHPKIKSLLVLNDHEIYVFQLQKDKPVRRLITRLGVNIKEVLWFAVETHILYLTDEGLHILEITDQKQNKVDYPEIKEVEKIFINSKGNFIFWPSKDNLYQGHIQ